MKPKEYKEKNEAFMDDKSKESDIQALEGGVLYKVLKSGDGARCKPGALVSVYYRGMTIDGKVFDDNTKQGYPDAFRLKGLIEGWQIAIPEMRVGDKWEIYIPWEKGYGSHGVDGIPKFSTLIFEIELVAIH